ncbi:MAG: lamin tail domain-containing protein [Candidatus Bathyarchaeota archaeon]|nr:lamin tail domain-containing protein [Candidatus Bathyarchaeota archaeon]
MKKQNPNESRKSDEVISPMKAALIRSAMKAVDLGDTKLARDFMEQAKLARVQEMELEPYELGPATKPLKPVIPSRKPSRPSVVWYLTPIILAFIGSIIGYFSLKSRDKKMARNVAILGAVISLVWFGIFIPPYLGNVVTEQPQIVATPTPTPTPTTIPAQTPTPTPTPIPTVYKVIEVKDGDSIVLEDSSEIRLLGINAPEHGYPYENESKTRLSELILGKNVTLESDFEDKDQYDRLLRYVFVNDIFVNVQLVKEGLATAYMESGLKYESQLLEAEDYAELNELGIWKKEPTYEEYIYVVTFHYDAAGNDHENLNDEYIILGNKGNLSTDMTSWTIKDEANHIFTFPAFVLKVGENVTIYSGSDINTEDSLYWNSEDAIWNNDGDTLYLRNAEGELIFSYEY